MDCLESVFAALSQVCFAEEAISLSDRKRGNLNVSRVESGDTWPDVD
jgi:hypothetical protein